MAIKLGPKEKKALNYALQQVDVPPADASLNSHDWYAQQVVEMALLRLGMNKWQAVDLATRTTGNPKNRLERALDIASMIY